MDTHIDGVVTVTEAVADTSNVGPRLARANGLSLGPTPTRQLCCVTERAHIAAVEVHFNGNDQSQRTGGLQKAWAQYAPIRRGVGPMQWCGTWVREVRTIEERVDAPPESEQDVLSKLTLATRETRQKNKQKKKGRGKDVG
jgi:hypothetical protein